ncbi:MAG TPA: hypothetical protein VM347_19270, partial [Nonomuraea sp.]|nr:hypothetical protein [Nonomuraea sp.]
MRPAALVRRTVAITAATAMISGGLAAGMLAAPAHAADAVVTGFSPSQWDNRSTVPMTVTGSGFSNASPLADLRDRVRLTPVVLDTQNEVGPFETVAKQSASTTTLAVDIPLSMAPTGEYTLQVLHFDDTGSNVPAQHFLVYGFGAANASSVAFGADPTGEAPLGADCDVLTSCEPRGEGALDISGSNIAIGAKVRFLKADGQPDPGLSFRQGNPNNDSNSIGTEDVDGVAGTGYASSTLLQGNYTAANDSSPGVTPGFTPGLHKVQIVNNDGKTTGATATFAQPWFAGDGALSPPGVGVGAKNTIVTLTGQGIRQGTEMRIDSGATGTPGTPGYCAGVSVGPAQVDPTSADGKGTFTRISAPVSMTDCATDNMSSRAVTLAGPDGARFSRPSQLVIVSNPTFGSIQSGYRVLGQGAHVGYDAGYPAEVVTITGTNFAGQGESDPAKMVKFSFGDGVTATTVLVSGPTSAQVHIDVDSDAPVGERVATVTNPNGGSSSVAKDELDPLDTAPLEVVEGPKVAKVDPPNLSSQVGSNKSITIRGTFDPDDSYVVVVCTHKATGVDCTPDPNLNAGSATLAEGSTTVSGDETLTFQVSTGPNAAAPGIRDLLVLDSTDKGRVYCTGCIGVDSLQLVSPLSGAPNTGPADVVFTLDDGGTIGPNSRATLTRLVPLTGNPAIAQRSGTVLTQAGNGQVTGSFDLRGAAPGHYSITVVKDRTTPATSQVWGCVGCLVVTGEAITTTAIDRVPTDGSAGTSTSG